MRFDVVIPTYNNLTELRCCLDALHKQTLRDFRVIVCVDGSTDGTLEWLRATSFDVDLVVCEHNDKTNHGRSAARNLALPHLQSEFLCMLDSDCVPSPDFLAQHASLLLRQDCVSLGDVRYTNADNNLWSAYAQSRGKNKFADGASIPYYYLATGNCAHRSELFRAIGGFDTDFRAYGGEDTDYGIRLHEHHALPLIFNAQAVAHSSMDKNLDEALEQLEEFGRVNLPLLHRKHPQQKAMYYVGMMSGHATWDHLRRMMLQPWASQFVRDLAPTFPQAIGVRMLQYCVLARMYKGWKAQQH